MLFHYNMYSVLGFINNYLLRLWIWSFWLATEVTLIICLFFESAHIFNLRISFCYFLDHGECNWKILVFTDSSEISNLICFYLSSLISTSGLIIWYSNHSQYLFISKLVNMIEKIMLARFSNSIGHLRDKSFFSLSIFSQHNDFSQGLSFFCSEVNTSLLCT